MSTETQSGSTSPPPSLIVDEEQPELTSSPVGTVFDKPREVTTRTKKSDIPSGLWIRCSSCGEMVTNKELEALLMVCPKCQFHFAVRAVERIAWLADEKSFEETDAGLSPVDPLGFMGVVEYSQKLKSNQKKTGLKDAVITGFGQLHEHKIGLAVMDFGFLGGSMGSVVGEKITRVVEASTQKKLPVIVVSTSGGARMYEGLFSLMQMAKTSAALARHMRTGLPYISVLTNPTMAGVMASFASLGDLIIAEPQAMIGFAGARVIRETTREELPNGFQTAEFLLERGLIDMIVHRKNMKSTLATLLEFIR